MFGANKHITTDVFSRYNRSHLPRDSGGNLELMRPEAMHVTQIAKTFRKYSWVLPTCAAFHIIRMCSQAAGDLTFWAAGGLSVERFSNLKRSKGFQTRVATLSKRFFFPPNLADGNHPIFSSAYKRIECRLSFSDIVS
ncbi:hypothetical protein NPIL_274181 [Nephila pilipes]|uniref:Uncharacterized protein n=1 Tax=Nephila pilipes TaxID=299642 RepID=A0A8X6PI64_NEPPI|nr:hypothetical protein NPIL_274181 [Nephila pilipes]